VEDCEVEIVRDDRFHCTHVPTLTCTHERLEMSICVYFSLLAGYYSSDRDYMCPGMCRMCPDMQYIPGLM
jgi:hypothetical protein